MTTHTPQAEFDDRPPALPIYLVGDRSISMEGEPIDMLNKMLEIFRIGFINHPAAGDVTRLAMASFSDSATLDVSLKDVVEIKTMPALSAGGNTAYGAAFELLASDIPSSLRALAAKGYKIFRPSIFFVTDGQPNDADRSRWDAYERLIDPENNWRPNIAVFGLGTADREICRKVAHGRGKAYFPVDGSDVAESLKKIIPEILKSVIGSAGAAAAGEAPPPPFPKEIEGFETCEPLDEVKL